MNAEPGRRAPIPVASETVDGGRQLDGKAFHSSCYAPTVSMYFDQLGNVRACCQNTGQLLGSVVDQSIREIWESGSAQDLRAALAADDYSRGCGFCGWQVEERGVSPFARWFDRYDVSEAAPAWPRQMEFALTNTCNLQCVMCNGDWSSSIRAHREQRPPLPTVYGEPFFEELAEFLPHLQAVNFIGGEPFMGREPLRVMEMMVDLGLHIPVTVTTNATHWSPRIERICRELQISFVVSLDGITKDTYESIRLGAEFDRVMRNIDRFISLVEGTSRSVGIAHCLMTPNWREFIDLLAYAERTPGLSSVGVNQVVFPRSLSLFQLPAQELANVVTAMEAQERERAGELQRFRQVWDDQLGALRNRLKALSAGRPDLLDPWTDHNAPFEPRSDESLRELAAWCGHAPYRIRCFAGWRSVDGQDVIRPIIEVDDRFADLVGEEQDAFVGRPMSDVIDALGRRLGQQQDVRAVGTGHRNHFETGFLGADGRVRQVQSLLVEDGDEALVLVGVRG